MCARFWCNLTYTTPTSGDSAPIWTQTISDNDPRTSRNGRTSKTGVYIIRRLAQRVQWCTNCHSMSKPTLNTSSRWRYCNNAAHFLPLLPLSLCSPTPNFLSHCANLSRNPVQQLRGRRTPSWIISPLKSLQIAILSTSFARRASSAERTIACRACMGRRDVRWLNGRRQR